MEQPLAMIHRPWLLALRVLAGVGAGLVIRTLELTPSDASHPWPVTSEPHKHLMSITQTDSENYCLLISDIDLRDLGYDTAVAQIDPTLQDPAGWERVRQQADAVDYRYDSTPCRPFFGWEPGDAELKMFVARSPTFDCPGVLSCVLAYEGPMFNPVTGHNEYRSMVLEFWFTEMGCVDPDPAGGPLTCTNDACGLSRPANPECRHHMINHMVGETMGLVPAGLPCGASVMHDYEGNPANCFDNPWWPSQADVDTVNLMIPIGGGAGNFGKLPFM